MQIRGVENTERKFDHRKVSALVLIPVVGSEVGRGADAFIKIEHLANSKKAIANNINSLQQIMPLCDARAPTHFRKNDKLTCWNIGDR